jgi:hypothetical protein
MLFIFSTKAIAFVVDFSVQYYVDSQHNFAGSILLSPSLAVSLVLQTLSCMINDSTLLNFNESSPSSSPTGSTTIPLRSLQEIIHNRITQKKGEIHRSHNRAYLDSLSIEIETLQWVLAQILTLLRRSQTT